jgi:hypothetical protein
MPLGMIREEGQGDRWAAGRAGRGELGGGQGRVVREAGREKQGRQGWWCGKCGGCFVSRIKNGPGVVGCRLSSTVSAGGRRDRS